MDEFQQFWREYIDPYTTPDGGEYPGGEEFSRRLHAKFAEKPYSLGLYSSADDVEGLEPKVKDSIVII